MLNIQIEDSQNGRKWPRKMVLNQVLFKTKSKHVHWKLGKDWRDRKEVGYNRALYLELMLDNVKFYLTKYT